MFVQFIGVPSFRTGIRMLAKCVGEKVGNANSDAIVFIRCCCRCRAAVSTLIIYYLFISFEFFELPNLHERGKRILWATHHTLCALGCCLLRPVVCCVGANRCRQLLLVHARLFWIFNFSFFSFRFEIVSAFVCDRNKFALKAERKIKQTVANFRGEDIFR